TDSSIRSATVSFLMRPGESHHPHAARLILDGIISDLGNPSTAPDAAHALSALGDICVDALSDRLAAGDAPIELRREIPDVLYRIGTPAACFALAGSLVQADPDLRSRLISALNKLREFHPALNLDR